MSTARFSAPPAAALVQQVLADWAQTQALCHCPTRYHPLYGVLRATGANRSLFEEAELLRRLATPLMTPGSHVLVAGAASEATLAVLMDNALGRGVHWTVADQCPAPLALVRRLAGERGEALHTLATPLHRLPAVEAPWDLIFMHYTLSFMDAALRAAALAALAGQLAPAGRLLCSAKFAPGQPAAAALHTPHATDPAADLAATHAGISRLFANAPAVLAMAQAHLEQLDAEKARQCAAQPSFEVLASEFANAGLRLSEVHPTRHERPLRRGQHSRVLLAMHAR